MLRVHARLRRTGHRGSGARNPVSEPWSDWDGRAYRRAIWAIAGGILVFGTLECVWALSLGSRQLLKDGLDWGYDVLLYGIAAFVFGRGATAERASALAIAAILAGGGVHTIYDLWDKVVDPRPIEPLTLGVSTASAIVIAYLVLGALWRFRRNANPLIRATWYSSRNDAISTTLFSLMFLATRLAPVRWPEYTLDAVGALISFQAAGAIVRAERRDRRRVDNTAASATLAANQREDHS
jgi:Co/Zn/Cd efflux system component